MNPLACFWMASLALLGLTGCVSPTAKTDPRIGAFSCNQSTLPEALMRLHDKLPTGPGSPRFVFRLYLRDRSVVEKPRTVALSLPAGTNDMPMEAWRTLGTNYESQIVSLDFRKERLLEVVRAIAEVSGLHDEVIHDESGSVTIRMGAAELWGDHPRLRRRTYRLTPPVPAGFTNFPTRLNASGSSIAFDPQSNLLTLIDDPSASYAGELIEILGGRCVYSELEWGEL